MYQYCMLVSLKIASVIKIPDLYIAGPGSVPLKTLERRQVSFLHSELVEIQRRLCRYIVHRLSFWFFDDSGFELRVLVTNFSADMKNFN